MPGHWAGLELVGRDHLRVGKPWDAPPTVLPRSSLQSHPNAMTNTNLCLFEEFGMRKPLKEGPFQPDLILQLRLHAAFQSPPCTCTTLPRSPIPGVLTSPPCSPAPRRAGLTAGCSRGSTAPGPCPAASTMSQIQPHPRLAAAWGRLSIAECTAPAPQHMIQ